MGDRKRNTQIISRIICPIPTLLHVVIYCGYVANIKLFNSLYMTYQAHKIWYRRQLSYTSYGYIILMLCLTMLADCQWHFINCGMHYRAKWLDCYEETWKVISNLSIIPMVIFTSCRTLVRHRFYSWWIYSQAHKNIWLLLRVFIIKISITIVYTLQPSMITRQTFF